ncbi:MAG: lysoplasmalogenase [Pseudomonadota bacterium]
MQKYPWLDWAIVASAALAILGATVGGDGIWVHYLFKPLTTILIFLRLQGSAPPVNLTAWRATGSAILMSLLGDIFLMLPKSLLAMGFELGLASFLVAHLLFLVAFTRDATLFGRPLPLVALLVASAGNLFALWPTIPGPLHLPVLVYMLCLVGMCAQAASRAQQLGTPNSRMTAFGALAFLLSDTLIAYDKFYAAIPAAPLLILGTYYLALYLIVRANSAAPSKVSS